MFFFFSDFEKKDSIYSVTENYFVTVSEKRNVMGSYRQ